MRTQTPVIFIIFNRADLTKRVFERIRAAAPEQLYVIADGPRPDVEGDAAEVAAARAEIQHDWAGEIIRDYSDVNLGCQQRIHSGITEAFKRYERAVVLEDDCLPHPDFFRFCEEMLERYASEPSVMHICGSNFVASESFRNAYAFTYHAAPWGWATWRRAWQRIDLSMHDFFAEPDVMADRLGISEEAWSKVIRRLGKVQTNEVCSWAYPWMASTIASGGLSVTPRSNLITNIGFDGRGTHTARADSFFANSPTRAIYPELTHPAEIRVDRAVNREAFDLFFGGKYRRSGRFWTRRRFWPWKR